MNRTGWSAARSSAALRVATARSGSMSEPDGHSGWAIWQGVGAADDRARAFRLDHHADVARSMAGGRLQPDLCDSSPKMWAEISTWCWTRSNERCSAGKIVSLSLEHCAIGRCVPPKG